MTVRATVRLTGVDRKTIARLALKVGRGCAELHHRMFVGIRTGRLELDELWAYVGKKQKRTKTHETEKGDQYTFVALASSMGLDTSISSTGPLIQHRVMRGIG